MPEQDANTIKPFPPVLGIKKLLGPSFIILALGLGSGEIILWPYLAANYGLGIAWGAILGITLQFFINMEIERYALLKGESVFVGIAKLCRWSVPWFIISTFIGFGLPGIVSASAKVLAAVVGVAEFKWLAILMLLVIGVILSVGKTVYGMMEKITKTVILLGVPLIITLVAVISSRADWSALASGLVGRGDGYWFMPHGIGLATFLAAFAYSGAGGNLNLTQSIYVKEKGYGMGRYSQKIAGLFRSKEKQKVRLTGDEFDVNDENIANFRGWWRAVNLEHFFVFWLIGGISMLMLMLLAFTTAFGIPGNTESINFVINEGVIIGSELWPIFGTIFLIIISVMLFQTQLGVMDSTSRIMAENFAIGKIRKNPNEPIALSAIYYFFVWAQIAFGIILFLANVHEPKTLIVLGAVINAFAMFVHTGLVAWLNHKSLPKIFRPSMVRKVIIGLTFGILGFFSLIVLLEKVGIMSVKI